MTGALFASFSKVLNLVSDLCLAAHRHVDLGEVTALQGGKQAAREGRIYLSCRSGGVRARAGSRWRFFMSPIAQCVQIPGSNRPVQSMPIWYPDKGLKDYEK